MREYVTVENGRVVCRKHGLPFAGAIARKEKESDCKKLVLVPLGSRILKRY